MNQKHRIVIVGGGFAGLDAALELDRNIATRPEIEITLINKENFFLFTPMLHEVAAGDLDLTNIVNPVRKLLKNVAFFEGEVQEIDLVRRRVQVGQMSRPKNATGSRPLPITIRPAVAEDGAGIARTFLESAKHHASLDPSRYAVPSFKAISTRYRDGKQHPRDAARDAITLVAELRGEVVGFVDVRLERSSDPMHRELVYWHIAEIAIRRKYQSRGIGGTLLQAAEAWGREHGADFASLEYLSANTRAGDFYQRQMGYRQAHIIAIKASMAYFLFLIDSVTVPPDMLGCARRLTARDFSHF